jgi:rhodanese-related sulfurtransferase/AcrR family transcriptional regulator
MSEATAEPVRRGRPRSEKARQAIVEAAVELLLVRGLAAVSMDAVAERAGVSKATIYRWWPSKETLALDALYHEWAAATIHPEAPSGGPLRLELLSALRPWIEVITDRAYGCAFAALLAEAQADPAFGSEYRARLFMPRREHITAIFTRAIGRGEIASDTHIELALDLIHGTLMHRLLNGHAPLDEPFVDDVVDAVLAGLVSTATSEGSSRSAHALEPALRPLTVDDVLALWREGAQVLDTRDPSDFARAHLGGAVNVGLSGSYATWCGTLLDPERALVIVADPGSEQDAAARLGRIGFERVEGYADGGMRTFEPFPDRIAHVDRVTATMLAKQLASDEPPLVVDVRTQREWCERRIAETINVPLMSLTQQFDQLPSDRPLVVHCEEGYRSAIAASLLLRAGFGAVADFDGGMEAWKSSDLETVGVGVGLSG